MNKLIKTFIANEDYNRLPRTTVSPKSLINKHLVSTTLIILPSGETQLLRDN